MRKLDWVGLGLFAVAAIVAVALHGGEAVAQSSAANCNTQSGFYYKTNGAGTACDAARNNYDAGSLLRLTALGVATSNGNGFRTYDARSAACLVALTAGTGSYSLVVKLQGYDTASGLWYDLLTSAALTSTGNTLLVVGGFTAVSNTVANLPLPAQIRASATNGGASSTVTASIGCNFNGS